MTRELYIHWAAELIAPVMYDPVKGNTFACVQCLSRIEIQRCDGTTRHYWELCQEHAPMYSSDDSSYDRAHLAELRESILHKLLRKPKKKECQPEPLWPGVFVDYKHTDGCIHGENVEYKALRGERLVEHGYGGRDEEARVVLQQDKRELVARSMENYWEVQKHGLPPLKCTPAKDGIRVYFKRCNGQFVDIDGFALPTIIDHRNSAITIAPAPTKKVDRDVEREGSQRSLLDTDNDLTGYEALKPSRTSSESSCPSLIEDTDDISLEILATPSWKEEMTFFSTQIYARHREEWAADLEEWRNLPAFSPFYSPLLPGIPSDTRRGSASNGSKGKPRSLRPCFTSRNRQIKKPQPSKTVPQPKVSLKKLMSREQAVYCGHTCPDTLISTMYRWQTKSPEARQAERRWRRELYISGNLDDDPLLERRSGPRTVLRPIDLPQPIPRIPLSARLGDPTKRR